jgi:SAM-dependent methyltransferase
MKPVGDYNFSTASPFLKKMLQRPELAEHAKDWDCLDVPSGNGRNTFLLGSVFRRVMAMDINAGYLKLIEEQKVNDAIRTAAIDLHRSVLAEAAAYHLVCAIHFYEEQFMVKLIRQMRPGTFLMVETPACHGGNFRELPNQPELSRLFNKAQILFADFKKCNAMNNEEGRGSYKALIKIN